MIKFKRRNILIVLVLMFAFSILINTIYIFARPLMVSADVNNLSNITLDDDFEDDCVLVVLDDSISLYNGISKKISKNLFILGAKKITDLSALPEKYLNDDGNIDAVVAPHLAEYYENNGFNQILRIDLKAKGKQHVLDIIEKISKIDGIISAEPNMIVSCGEVITDDPYLSDQWGIDDSKGINSYDAWNITTGDKNVYVGVIDSGIANHADLNANVTTGYDFYNNNSTTTDDNGGHGTHVAGIIGAVGNNGIGVSGVSQNVTLVPLQTAYDTSGSGSHYTEDIIEAIDYARKTWETNQRISILNYSISHFGKDTTLLNAIKNFPGLFVWSAGNDGENVDAYKNASEFNLPNLISVGSINYNGNRSEFSNYGEKSVSIYAPGGNILSTYPTSLCNEEISLPKTHYDKGYHYNSGTSMAAPHVTGVAALMLSYDPTLTAAELKEAILLGADDITISIPNSSQNVKKLNAYKALKAIDYNVIFDKQGGQGGDSGVCATYGEAMPSAEAPTREGYTFKGYYSQPNGNGAKYYDGPDMISVHNWDKTEMTTLYAYWEPVKYTVTLHYNFGNGSGKNTVKVAYGEQMPLPYGAYAPINEGYEFVGYFSNANGTGTKYYSMEIMSEPCSPYLDTRYFEGVVSIRTWDQHSDGDLYAYWEPLECTYTYENIILNEGFLEPSTAKLKHGEKATITAKSFDGYTFKHFYYFKYNDTYPYSTVEWDMELKRSETDGLVYPQYKFYAVYEKSCIAEGTLITLANGEQVPVEQLTGNETLLVWNLYTGTFDTAPILFIDKDSPGTYQVINLYFSDGTQVKVISEHGFWDFNLNRYVYLDENASEYIGHWFNKQITDDTGNFAWGKVQLTDVVIEKEYTTAYSPVTYSHLCYYVNGMLSMPGGIDGLFNIFDVDSETMSYDKEAMANDIEQYGLFTYEEFAEILPVSEEVFNAFSGQYLKVAIGKGLIDFDTLTSLVERYQKFF